MAQYFGKKLFDKNIYLIGFDDKVLQGEQGPDSLPNIDIQDNISYLKKYKSTLFIGDEDPTSSLSLDPDSDTNINAYYYNTSNGNYYIAYNTVNGFQWINLYKGMNVNVPKITIEDSFITYEGDELIFKTGNQLESIKVDNLKSQHLDCSTNEFINLNDAELQMNASNTSDVENNKLGLIGVSFDDNNLENNKKTIAWINPNYWTFNGSISVKEVVNSSSDQTGQEEENLGDLEYVDLVIGSQDVMNSFFDLTGNTAIDNNFDYTDGKKINTIVFKPKNTPYEVNSNWIISKSVNIICQPGAVLDFNGTKYIRLDVDNVKLDLNIINHSGSYIIDCNDTDQHDIRLNTLEDITSTLLISGNANTPQTGEIGYSYYNKIEIINKYNVPNACSRIGSSMVKGKILATTPFSLSNNTHIMVNAIINNNNQIGSKQYV